MTPRILLAALLCAAPLAACAGAGAPSPMLAARSGAEAPAVRLQALNAATELERGGRLRDARWRLEVARAADPSDGEAAARLARLDARMAAEADRLAAEGASLERAGRTDPAKSRYQAALELRPAQAAARERLEALNGRAVLAAIARSPAGGPRPASPAYAKARRPAHRTKSDG